MLNLTADSETRNFLIISDAAECKRNAERSLAATAAGDGGEGSLCSTKMGRIEDAGEEDFGAQAVVVDERDGEAPSRRSRRRPPEDGAYEG